jgi:hypothetical protein
MIVDFDDDAIAACADLVGRTGAKQFKIGYLHDNVPVEEAGWYAHAQFQGARIDVEGHRGPVEAADALCRRLLTGAQCAHCKGVVTISDAGAAVYQKSTLIDGTPWNADDTRRAKQCRWRRMGSRWVRGCEPDGRD